MGWVDTDHWHYICNYALHYNLYSFDVSGTGRRYFKSWCFFRIVSIAFIWILIPFLSWWQFWCMFSFNKGGILDILFPFSLTKPINYCFWSVDVIIKNIFLVALTFPCYLSDQVVHQTCLSFLPILFLGLGIPLSRC